MAPIRLLYVEDDERLARLTSEYLGAHGLEIHWVGRGDEALSAVQRIRPDVVLLDLMLPGIDGMEVCRQIRARHDVPIIMVTARNESSDRVQGLDGGADDYVPKPVQSRELLARINAQARRGRGELGPKAEKLVVGELVIDLGAREVHIRGTSVGLTTNEFELLAALAQRAGRVLSREQLLDSLHGSQDEAFDRSIDVVISRLRSKLEVDPKNPRFIKTIRGSGYVLTPGDP